MIDELTGREIRGNKVKRTKELHRVQIKILIFLGKRNI